MKKLCMAVMAIASLVMVGCQGEPVLKTQEGKLLNEIQTNVMEKTQEQANAYLTSKGYVSVNDLRAPKKMLAKANAASTMEAYAKVDATSKEVQMVELAIKDKKVVGFNYAWEYAAAPDKSMVLNVIDYAEVVVKPFDTFYAELADKKENETGYAEVSKAYQDAYKKNSPEEYEDFLEMMKEYAGHDAAALKEAINKQFSSIIWMEAEWIKITDWEELDGITSGVGLENEGEGFFLYYFYGNGMSK